MSYALGNQLSAKKRNRYIKTLIDDAKKDRKMALETFEYFKKRLADDPTDREAGKQMAECLKLAQTANKELTKLVDLSVKNELMNVKTHVPLPGKVNARDYNSVRNSAGSLNEQFPAR